MKRVPACLIGAQTIPAFVAFLIVGFLAGVAVDAAEPMSTHSIIDRLKPSSNSGTRGAPRMRGITIVPPKAPVSPAKPKPESPADNNVAKPLPDNVAKPQPEDVATPQPDIVAKPRPDNVATPQPDNVAKPQPDNVATPQPDNVAKPLPEIARPLVPPSINFAISFALNSTEFDANAVKVLGELGEALRHRELKPYRFEIAGHTDAAGSAGYNQRLSEQRAHAVRRYLTKTFDIEARRLRAIGFGESHLLDRTNPLSGANRRVQITNLGRR